MKKKQNGKTDTQKADVVEEKPRKGGGRNILPSRGSKLYECGFREEKPPVYVRAERPVEAMTTAKELGFEVVYAVLAV